MDRKKLVIIGAGGFGREVFHLVNSQIFEIVGFLDKGEDNTEDLPAPILGDDAMIDKLKTDSIAEVACVAIGNMSARARIFQALREAGIGLPQIIHSSAVILSKSFGAGVIIYPQVVVMNDCSLGDGVLLNSGVTLGHDVSIGDFSNINPGAHLAGRIRIGEQTMIGIGACLRENLQVGARCIVGAGSVVVTNVNDDSTVYGVPAKPRLA